jgi:hypothetical protein
MKIIKIYFVLFIAGLFTIIVGCSEKGPTEAIPSSETQFEELNNQGIDRYLGIFTPAASEIVSQGESKHIFRGTDGPMSYTGKEFYMYTRDGSSNNLLIFLQGGGFCSPVACEAVDEVIPLISFGILNPLDASNPTANYDLGYISYCDGSGMMGDNEVDSDGDGVIDRFFRGVKNLSASLDVIFQKYPSPNKIVLAGNSAGGFAVHAALPLVRKLYPAVRIDVINDSGQGIANPGAMQMLIDYWNAGAFFSSDCIDCIGADGNLTNYHKYQLDQDPNIRLAYISSKQDDTYAAIISGGGPAFEAQLIEAAKELKSDFPERFNYLIADGDEHTFIIKNYDYSIGGTTVKMWIDNMLNDNANWVSVMD